jgi:hypothetical protein
MEFGVKWIQYRGPGSVTFDPPGSAPVYGKPATQTTSVHFSEPGGYVIRAVAHDGALQSVHDFKINVRAPGN